MYIYIYNLLYKFKQIFFFFIFYLLCSYLWYSFEISDFIRNFDFINYFDLKSFGLILILKFKFLLKTKVYALYMKKYFVVYVGVNVPFILRGFSYNIIHPYKELPVQR